MAKDEELINKYQIIADMSIQFKVQAYHTCCQILYEESERLSNNFYQVSVGQPYGYNSIHGKYSPLEKSKRNDNQNENFSQSQKDQILTDYKRFLLACNNLKFYLSRKYILKVRDSTIDNYINQIKPVGKNKNNNLNEIDEDEKPIFSKEDKEETRQSIFKIIEESGMEIHDGRAQYGGNYQKLDKEIFVDKLNQKKQNEALYNVIKDYSWDERYNFVYSNKQKGNRLFKKGFYNEAKEIYTEGLIGLVFDSGDKQKDLKMRDELQIPMLLNIATCMIHQDLNGSAVQILEKAIKLNDLNYKTHCKLGQAYTGLVNFERANKHYLKSLELVENLEERQDILKLYKKMRGLQKQQVQKYKKMFENQKQQNESIQQETITDDKINDLSFIQGINVNSVDDQSSSEEDE
ncbi:hypothetical protein PPERSA_11866 [Pseudocohnilembus persalinus]|uniref:Uncharacterized protein n=1 Tax=Pseudocohnilembus persalinus TaxID=266149 RepID=A0A0V0QJT6_PSEPJ|nr:hypothetical protein PPERSA_11866 [Pseudocohnilembus persalinus]|eukprot:KRX02526.1 hypothetical protein PPERSA_11866 [Pseudocohnilembus persalinus]